MEIRVTIELLHPAGMGAVIEERQVLVDHDSMSALGDVEQELDEVIDLADAYVAEHGEEPS